MQFDDMMTSSNASIFRVTGHLCGEVPGEFHAQRPVTRSFDVFFDLRPNKGWVNNGEAGDLRRYRVHCDVIVMEYEIMLKFLHHAEVPTSLVLCVFHDGALLLTRIKLNPNRDR